MYLSPFRIGRTLALRKLCRTPPSLIRIVRRCLSKKIPRTGYFTNSRFCICCVFRFLGLWQRQLTICVPFPPHPLPVSLGMDKYRQKSLDSYHRGRRTAYSFLVSIHAMYLQSIWNFWKIKLIGELRQPTLPRKKRGYNKTHLQSGTRRKTSTSNSSL